MNGGKSLTLKLQRLSCTKNFYGAFAEQSSSHPALIPRGDFARVLGHVEKSRVKRLCEPCRAHNVVSLDVARYKVSTNDNVRNFSHNMVSFVLSIGLYKSDIVRMSRHIMSNVVLTLSRRVMSRATRRHCEFDTTLLTMSSIRLTRLFSTYPRR